MKMNEKEFFEDMVMIFRDKMLAGETNIFWWFRHSNGVVRGFVYEALVEAKKRFEAHTECKTTQIKIN